MHRTNTWESPSSPHHVSMLLPSSSKSNQNLVTSHHLYHHQHLPKLMQQPLKWSTLFTASPRPRLILNVTHRVIMLNSRVRSTHTSPQNPLTAFHSERSQGPFTAQKAYALGEPCQPQGSSPPFPPAHSDPANLSSLLLLNHIRRPASGPLPFLLALPGLFSGISLTLLPHLRCY